LPFIAALNGTVYGGSTDLALACDFRIGVEGMRLSMPAARLGTVYYPRHRALRRPAWRRRGKESVPDRTTDRYLGGSPL